jgi:hypothetical protein
MDKILVFVLIHVLLEQISALAYLLLPRRLHLQEEEKRQYSYNEQTWRERSEAGGGNIFTDSLRFFLTMRWSRDSILVTKRSPYYRR